MEQQFNVPNTAPSKSMEMMETEDIQCSSNHGGTSGQTPTNLIFITYAVGHVCLENPLEVKYAPSKGHRGIYYQTLWLKKVTSFVLYHICEIFVSCHF